MTSEAPAEKRTGQRRRAIKIGKIVFNQRNSVIDCTLRNISQTGAMVSVTHAVSVPDEFELRWDDKARLCTVVWRKLDKFGVKFET
jgi:hypothetical protein